MRRLTAGNMSFQMFLTGEALPAVCTENHVEDSMAHLIHECFLGEYEDQIEGSDEEYI